MTQHLDKLVEETLSVLPLMSKKLFGPVHVLHDTELNHTHFTILHIIDISDHQRIRTTEVAERLAVQKSNVTPLLRKLMEKEYIAREQDEDDRRVYHLYLTEAGRRFFDSKKQQLEEEVKGRMEGMSLEDQTRLRHAVHELHDVLSRVHVPEKQD
ncbi:MarR family winged helix-turn-helix transcriptional regulator [Alkalicoccus chagannorensis]|uniref:MarR family winged helix-turn-helix transcriptional regulator n=1 Tax=Alkalicoccus chagannorensis TaxID=427072 RepID=UPI000423DB1A|nr:MarR family transcriptional regulator [Alkalicoccus chagannorensis]